jgi:hypothetical protein
MKLSIGWLEKLGAMRTHAIQTFLLATVLICTNFADEPAISLKQAPPPYLGFRMNISGIQTVLIERSTNMIDWNPHINVFTKVSSFGLFDRSSDPKAPFQLFRASDQAQSLNQMLTNWQQLHIRDYRFHFTRVCECDPPTLQGTVTVIWGDIAGITYDLPFLSHDEEFMTIDQIFAQLFPVPTPDLLEVQFDPEHFFPTFAYIDRYFLFVDDETEYRVDNFVVLP